jgi:hypothetical protein
VRVSACVDRTEQRKGLGAVMDLQCLVAVRLVAHPTLTPAHTHTYTPTHTHTHTHTPTPPKTNHRWWAWRSSPSSSSAPPPASLATPSPPPPPPPLLLQAGMGIGGTTGRATTTPPPTPRPASLRRHGDHEGQGNEWGKGGGLEEACACSELQSRAIRSSMSWPQSSRFGLAFSLSLPLCV